MLASPKVSIVVPIFKVEKYIRRCLESIIQQTYFNLEIILVDDGSPDRCGEIAEEYKKLDSRVIVTHKQNGGLSDARNHGIQLVTGEFTLFVDSDDWLECNAVETMVSHSVQNDADIVQSAFYYAYDDYLLYDNRYFHAGSSPVVLDNEQLMKELVINEKVKNFAWGKLFRTSLIIDIPFKKGVLFEDVFWAHQVMHKVDCYLMLNHPLYFYFQRNDSIVANYTTKNLDILDGLWERHSFIETHYPNLRTESYQIILKNCFIHYNLLLRNRSKDKKGVHRKKVKSYILSHYDEIKDAIKGDTHLKRQLELFSFHPLCNFSYLAFKKLIRMLVRNKKEGLQQVEIKQGV